MDIKLPWWKQPTNQAHEQLWALLEVLDKQDKPRHKRYENYSRLYGGATLDVTDPVTANTRSGYDERVRLNVTRAAIDTVTAKVGKLRPRPTFAVEGANWSLQQRAKNLQRFMDGAYHQSDVYATIPGVFRDAMIYGTGVLHPYRVGKKLRCERVPPWLFRVDAVEAVTGRPRTLHRIRYVDQNVLIARFPKFRAAIEESQKVKGLGVLDDIDTGFMSPGKTEMVQVLETWRLPDVSVDDAEEAVLQSRGGVKQSGGRYVCCVEKATLIDEPWEHDHFPFVIFHWSEPQVGFWGDSAAAEVAGIQLEINRILESVQKSFKLVGNPWVLIPAASDIETEQVTNEIGLKLKVSGPASAQPQVVSFRPVDPEILNHLWALYDKAFEILGSNQLAAAAVAPPGMESGRAVERLSEEHSERFMTVSRQFQFLMGEVLSRHFIRLAKELDELLKPSGGFQVNTLVGKSIIKLAWNEVDIDPDSYLIQVFDTSALPTNPAMKAREVERLMAAGMVDRATALRLLDMPDLHSYTDLETADSEMLDKQLEQMLYKGKAATPLPYQDLNRALRLAQFAALRAELEGVPEENIDLVRDFMAAVEALIPPPPPAAPGQPPPPPPGA